MPLKSRPGPREAELESPLVDVDDTSGACDAGPRFNAPALRSLVGGTLPMTKLSISVVTKCSPSTTSNGKERGIIERL